MSGIDEGMMPEHVQPQRQDDGTRDGTSDEDRTQKKDAGIRDAHPSSATGACISAVAAPPSPASGGSGTR